MPSTNPRRSATCARTLLACRTSARLPSAASLRGQIGRPKNSGRRSGCRAPRPPPWRRSAPARSPGPGYAGLPCSTARGSRRCWRPRPPATRPRARARADQPLDQLARVRQHRLRERREVEVRSRNSCSGGTVSVICTSVQVGQKTRSSGKRGSGRPDPRRAGASWRAASCRATGPARGRPLPHERQARRRAAHAASEA